MTTTRGISRRTRFLALAAVTALLAMAAPDAASAVTAVAGETAVSPTTTLSPRNELVDLLGGSSDYLVYELVPVVAGEVGGSGSSTPFPSRATFSVVDAAGHTTPLALPYTATGVSVEGSFVAAQASATSSDVDWVDLSGSTSGTTAMPASARFIGATPTGWAYLLGAGVWEETPAGTSTYLGAPVTDSGSDPAGGGAVGPDGVMTWLKSGAIGYLSYADPSHPVSVQPGYEFPEGESLDCSLDESDAVCQVATSNDTTNFLYGERLSLTGGAALTFNNRFEGQALDDITTAWTNLDQETTTLVPVNGSASTVLLYSTQLASAFGKIALTNSSDTAIEMVSAATDAQVQLVAPTRSPALATSFALTPGRVVWADDEANPAAPNTTSINTVSRAVASDGGSIHLGSPSIVGTSGAFKGELASGATTAYAEDPGSPQPVIGAVVSPRGSTTFRVAAPEDAAQLSGNRLLYDGDKLLDLRTDKTTTVGVTPAGDGGLTLWGNYLGYVKANGTVWRENLSTGTSAKVASPLAGKSVGESASGQVFIFGRHLGWVIDYSSGSGTRHVVQGVLDVSTPSDITSLPKGQGLWALSSDGIVTDDTTQTGTNDATFSLLGYGKSATLTQLVPEAPRLTGVDVDSGLMAWLDDGDVVEAAPLSTAHVADRPISLGDPVAPKTLVSPGAGEWTAYVPFSAALTSCAIVIRHGATVLRTLACDPTDMADGDAYAQWDGRNSKGNPVAAGDDTWTVQASNADGHVLTSSGSTGAVTGPIAVGVSSHVSLSVSSSRVDRGASDVMAGHITVGGKPGRQLHVVLQRRLKGQATYHRVARTLTSASGRFSVTVHPSVTAHYRVEFAGTAVDHGATSEPVSVTVVR